MAQRKTLSKKLRFEVFKRDKFSCQYCGRSAPDVVLEVDHIKPVSKAGDDDMLNLITSCRDCNAGKGACELSDEGAVAKRRAQLEDLQERREQIEMMLEWQSGLEDLTKTQVDGAAGLWGKLVPGYRLNDAGLEELAQLIRQFGLAEVLESLRISASLCTECGASCCELHAHHIRSWADYPPGHFDVTNGLTLCASCHKAMHGKGR